jgi:signal transduction histidine kinase
LKSRSLLNPFRWFSIFFSFLKDVLMLIRRHVETNIRLQLILTFVVCLLASLMAGSMTKPYFDNSRMRAVINYRAGIDAIEWQAQEILNQLNREFRRYEQESERRARAAAQAAESAAAAKAGASSAQAAGEGRPAAAAEGGNAGTAAAGAVAEVEAAETETSEQTAADSDTADNGQAAGDAANEETPQPAANINGQIVPKVIEEYGRFRATKVLVLDLDGKVMYRSANATENQVDLHSVIRNAMGARHNEYENREYFTFFPIDLKDQKAYLVVSGMPEPSIEYRQYGSSPGPVIVGIIAFILLFFWITKGKIRYIRHLADGLQEVSTGNLDYRVTVKSRDELGTLAESINRMTAELKAKIEEERRAEKTKNELITNVSHDLRTPLTLIMGYLRLLKDKQFESAEQAESYINLVYSKSEKLKSLIDDLFEYTKLSNKGDVLKLQTVCINELLEQLLEEMVSYAEDNGVTLVKAFPAERLMVQVDPDKLIRVFDNLLTNAVKYSDKPGTVRLLMFREFDSVKIRISNFGKPLTQEEVGRLFDRFYRVDASRSSETGGSGLGLAIAKSIIDFHGGEIWAECEGNEIRFWVRLKLAN